MRANGNPDGRSADGDTHGTTNPGRDRDCNGLTNGHAEPANYARHYGGSDPATADRATADVAVGG